MTTTAQQPRYRDGDVAVRPGTGRWQAWQSIDTGRLLLLGGSAVLVAFSVTQLVGIKQSSPAAIAFGLFIAFG